MTWSACLPDRGLWAGFVYPTLALVAARQAAGAKGGDAVSLEREPSQLTVLHANYRCHPSALGMQ